MSRDQGFTSSRTGEDRSSELGSRVRLFRLLGSWRILTSGFVGGVSRGSSRKLLVKRQDRSKTKSINIVIFL